jgi:hypothetical protein
MPPRHYIAPTHYRGPSRATTGGPPSSMFSATNPRTFGLMVLPECQVLSFARHHIEAFAERLDIFIGDGSKLDLHCGD